MITRKDILDKRLRSHWMKEGKELEQNINAEAIQPGVVYDILKFPTGSNQQVLNSLDEGDGEDDGSEEEDGRVYHRSGHQEKLQRKDSTGSSVDQSDDAEYDSLGQPPQESDWLSNIGISRRRGMTIEDRDAFYNEDDHLETEDSPELEFQDRLHRNNSKGETPIPGYKPVSENTQGSTYIPWSLMSRR
jgi:hypothetical protein